MEDDIKDNTDDLNLLSRQFCTNTETCL